MKKYLYDLMVLIAWVHDRILKLNVRFPWTLTDKQLHFVVIGLLGMLLFFVIHPLFKLLVRHGQTAAVSWLYVFTLILMLTFSIEIGQHVSHTGALEFADIVFGVVGFLSLFAVYALALLLARAIARLSRARRSGPIQKTGRPAAGS